MIKKVKLFFVLTLAIVTSGMTQGKLDFENKEYDFGDVREQDGPVEHSFPFVNTSEDSIKITYVKASCGCTTPGWSREVLAPGDSGFVTARYNPYNRPGPFKKSLRVNTDKRGGFVLYIKGNVIPRPRTVNEMLPVEVGNLRFKFSTLNMGKITTKEPVTKVFQLYNQGDTSVAFLPGQEFPSFLEINFEPDTLKGKEYGEMFITYDPSRRGDLGYLRDNIQLATTDSLMSQKNLTIVASITEYFPPLSEEEREDAPRLFIDDPNFDFGRLQPNVSKEGSITLINNGQSKLKIRKIESNCDCLKATLDGMEIKPGKSEELSVKFDAENRRGRQYKTITIFSNDPVAPTQVISVKADVNQ